MERFFDDLPEGMKGMMYVNLFHADDEIGRSELFQKLYKRQIVELRKYGRIVGRGDKYIDEILDPMNAIVCDFLKKNNIIPAITEMIKIIDEVMYLKDLFPFPTYAIDSYLMSCSNEFINIERAVQDANIRSILFEYLRELFYDDKYKYYNHKPLALLTLIKLCSSRVQLEIVKSIYGTKLTEEELFVLDDEVVKQIRIKEQKL